MYNQLHKIKQKFLQSESGEGSVQVAVYFGAMALAMALVGVPVLNKASREYADNQAYGIDQTVTGSIDKPKRYTIRKSVLDDLSK